VCVPKNYSPRLISAVRTWLGLARSVADESRSAALLLTGSSEDEQWKQPHTPLGGLNGKDESCQ